MQPIYGNCIQGSDPLIEREKVMRNKLNRMARTEALKYYNPDKVRVSAMW